MGSVKYLSREHKEFHLSSIVKAPKRDSYHNALFYVLGLTEETRRNMGSLYSFEEDSIKPEGLRKGWQTGVTVKVCRLAFNLWNGYVEEGMEEESTPYELCACELMPYFLEAVRIKYAEYLGKS